MTTNTRLDYKIILSWIPKGASVLDLGCGEGELLELIMKEKAGRCQGIEIDEKAIYKCIARGLNVLHGDIDSGLAEYNDKSFDYVVLDQSLQQVTHLDSVLKDALRVGKKVIVGFPNFAYYKARLQMFFQGKAPVTGPLPYQWYETPNLHFLSISDFGHYCRKKDIRIERWECIGTRRKILFFRNLFSQVGIFLISTKD